MLSLALAMLMGLSWAMCGVVPVAGWGARMRPGYDPALDPSVRSRGPGTLAEVLHQRVTQVAVYRGYLVVNRETCTYGTEFRRSQPEFERSRFASKERWGAGEEGAHRGLRFAPNDVRGAEVPWWRFGCDWRSDPATATPPAPRGPAFVPGPFPAQPEPVDGIVSTSGWQVVVPMRIPVAVLLVWPAARGYRWMFPRRRPEWVCRRCGYDLRGTPDRCPECGLKATALRRKLERWLRE